MKQSGQCPKCESMNIWNNSHVHVGRKPPLTKRWIIVSITGLFSLNRKYAFKDEYVCMDCGYSETFIEKESLKTIREYGVTEQGDY